MRTAEHSRGPASSDAHLTVVPHDEAIVSPSGNTYDLPSWGLDGGISPWNAGVIPVPEPSVGILLLFGSSARFSLTSRRRSS